MATELIFCSSSRKIPLNLRTLNQISLTLKSFKSLNLILIHKQLFQHYQPRQFFHTFNLALIAVQYLQIFTLFDSLQTRQIVVVPYMKWFFTDVDVAQIDHFAAEANIYQVAVFCFDDGDRSAGSVVSLILSDQLVDHVSYFRQ